jgi:hypothetical protein
VIRTFGWLLHRRGGPAYNQHCPIIYLMNRKHSVINLILSGHKHEWFPGTGLIYLWRQKGNWRMADHHWVLTNEEQYFYNSKFYTVLFSSVMRPYVQVDLQSYVWDLYLVQNIISVRIYCRILRRRVYDVLTSVQNTQNYWVSWLCPSSETVNTR